MPETATLKRKLDNKIIMVTGATDGIGKQAALSFAAQGATVILVGKRIPGLEKTYDAIQQANHPEPIILPINLAQANFDDYQQVATQLRLSLGRLDGILHNAGEVGNLTPIELYDVQQWYRVLQVNLNAPFLLTQALLPILKQASQANILFTLAEPNQLDKAYWGAYSVAKSGITSLMHILSQELTNTAIRVNGINPGAVKTKLRANIYPGEDLAHYPLPEKIMETYIDLMANSARSTHGLIIDAQAGGFNPDS